MKETVYRCNRCKQQIKGTINRISAIDVNGQLTKYGTLMEDIDLCDTCMEEVTLAVMKEIDGEEQQDEKAESPEGQQENESKKTYKCSQVMKTCKYAEKCGGALTCGYITIEGHRRGCDPEECDKYKKVERKRGRKPSEEKKKSMPAIVEG